MVLLPRVLLCYGKVSPSPGLSEIQRIHWGCFRELGSSMDSLKCVSSWKGAIQDSKLPITVGGLQLEGCLYDGTQLSESQHDSPSVSSIPPCVIAWIPKVSRAASVLLSLQLSLGLCTCRAALFFQLGATAAFCLTELFVF